jgi:hypothetical protein
VIDAVMLRISSASGDWFVGVGNAVKPCGRMQWHVAIPSQARLGSARSSRDAITLIQTAFVSAIACT